MALIKCPECGREISDKAPNCPNCGYVQDTASVKGSVDDAINVNVNKIEKTGKKWKSMKIWGWISIIVGFCFIGSDPKFEGPFVVGIILLIFGVIWLISAKFGNWWDRG
jgi:hypothetical protein